MMGMKNTSPVDHYIQADILRALYVASVPLSFTVLKEDGIENSLFMYHMNKLIGRGVVEKAKEGGFQLTVKGTIWVNNMGEESIQPEMRPKILINFVVTTPSKARFLLARRRGIPAEHLNEYLFPGGLLKFGVSMDESARSILQKRSLDLAEPVCLGMQEFINTNDDFVYHSVNVMYELILSQEVVLETDARYDYVWCDANDVLSFSDDSPLVNDFIQRYLAGDYFVVKSLVVNR
jgi:ADP-ribose pyrophosphatase YjhB (NUDIX family)